MEPKIAIIGASCRLPGKSQTLDHLWEILVGGADVVTEIPPHRFNRSRFYHPHIEEPGKSYTFAAGVVDSLELFDAAFFGISPREAEQLDPQQRLLLELAWEALENAGLPFSSLAGTSSGVFLGISSIDAPVVRADDTATYNAHTMIGNTFSVAANRLSYFLNWHGPSMAIDTACSSSLVAFHQACQALQNPQIPVVLAAGVNALVSPNSFVGFSKASMLSPDGRCKAFDATGRGYVRAEGGIIVVLKRLEDARRDDDTILGVVEGCGINSDGATNGLSFPGSESQLALLRRIYEGAGVDATKLAYVEAHGTGTAAGDPVEAEALGLALGQQRPSDHPLPIGSVKTNIGHLEPASGLAGLLKALLVLRHRQLPPSLHFHTPNPNIDFAGLNVRVVRELETIPPTTDPLWVGVNSFGVGGANAHILLRSEPAAPSPVHQAPTGAPPPLILSAQTPTALRQLATAYADFLEQQPESAYYDMAWTAAYRREWLSERLFFQPSEFGCSQAAAALRAFVLQGWADGITVVSSAVSAPLALVFSGNGAQWPGMMGELLGQHSGFAEALARVDTHLQKLVGWTATEYLQRPPEEQHIEETSISQPLLYAIQAAMVDVLREEGIPFATAFGHSVGEIAAAYAVGGLTLEQGARVIVERSRCQEVARGQGAMAAAGLSAEAAEQRIRALGLDLEVSAINSPNGITVAGSEDGLEKLGQLLEKESIFYRKLGLDYAFHSRFMDPVEAPLTDSLHDLDPQESTLPFISTVTGESFDTRLLVSDYWWHNVRQPVLFAQATRSAMEMGTKHFLEIGPHGIFRHALTETLDAAQVRGQVLLSARKGESELATWSRALAGARLVQGPAACASYFSVPGRLVQLPNYPWEHEVFPLPQTREASPRVHGQEEHPLLGTRIEEFPAVWEKHLELSRDTWLRDHRAGKTVLFPAAGYIEMLVAAARLLHPEKSVVVRDMEIRRPMALNEGEGRCLRLRLIDDAGSAVIESRTRLGEDDWTPHAVATLEADVLPAAPLAPEEVSHVPVVISAETHQAAARAMGLEYGPAFCPIQEARIFHHSIEGDLAVPGLVEKEMSEMVVPPVLIDGAFQLLIDLLKHLENYEDHAVPAYLASRMATIRVEAAVPKVTGARTVWRKTAARSILADVDLLASDGSVAVQLRTCRFQKAPLRQQSEWSDLLYCWEWIPARGRVEWNPRPLPPSDTALQTTREELKATRDAADRNTLLQNLLSRHADWLPALWPFTERLSTKEATALRPSWLEPYLDGVPEVNCVQGWMADTLAQSLHGRPTILLLAPESSGWPRLVSTTLPPGKADLVITHPDPLVLEQLRTELTESTRFRFVAWDAPILVDVALTAWLHPVVTHVENFWTQSMEWLRPGAAWIFAQEAPHAAELFGAGFVPQKITGEQSVVSSVGRAGVLEIGQITKQPRQVSEKVSASPPPSWVWAGPDHPWRGDLETVLGPLPLAESPAAIAASTRLLYAASTLDIGDIAQNTPSSQVVADFLEWFQQLPAGLLQGDLQIAVLTSGAWSRHPEHAALWGLVRVLSNEFPKTKFRLIDLQEGGLAHLREVMDDGFAEREIRCTAAGWEVPRMTKWRPSSARESLVKLDTPSPGLLDRLRWEATDAWPLGPGAIRLSVDSVGLNFRDVMWAMGLLPDEALEAGFAGPCLGLECAGRVLEVGTEVVGLQPGDRVMGFGPACFGTEIVTTAAAVVRIPEHLSFAEAAALPSTFFTAYYSLNFLARLASGEKILVHGAAGGVGLAALQLARLAGGEIFATAGSEEKRQLLRSLGVDHVLDSRSLHFAEEIRHLTHGYGVDVVLNSLAGKPMQASLDLLAPYGRFLELGKRDFYANSRLAMRALRNNVAYHGIDADQLMVSRPELCQRLFAELMELFHERKLHPIPIECYPATRIVDAFRRMQQSRHVGKIVVTMAAPSVLHPVPGAAAFSCRQDRSYLVTGGLAGFGLASAEWLADHGARHLVLVSRRGQPTPEDAAKLETLRRNGVTVEYLSVDVSNEAAVQNLLAPSRERPPLGGIIHAAAVFDDRIAANIDRASLEKVWQPKVQGALWLDRHSRALNLDWMVFYSSATTFIGNPGQANYVAANAALEALAAERSAAGHPTLAVAWGAIDDAGHLTQHEEVKEILAGRLGREPLPARKALFTMGQLLARGFTGTTAVLPLEWSVLRKNLPLARTCAYEWMEALAGGDFEDVNEAIDYQTLARDLPEAELQTMITESLTHILAQILRLAPDKIDPARPVAELGMDSLMTLEMGMAIEGQFGVQPSALHLSSTITLRGMAESLLREIQQSAQRTENTTASDSDDKLQRLSAIIETHGVEIAPEAVEEVLEEILDPETPAGRKSWTGSA